jgi:hypothetical protein
MPFSLLSNDNEGNTIEYFFDKEALVYKTVQFKKNAKANDKWMYKLEEQFCLMKPF